MKYVVSFLFAMAMIAPLEASGQGAEHITLWGMAGRFSFDLSGTGDATVAIVRVDRNLSRVFLGEIGLGYTFTRQQFEQNIPYIFPELQIQAQLPLGRWRPYLGAGGALFIDARSDRSSPYITWPNGQPGRGEIAYSLSGGLRAFLTKRLGARLELRVRGIGRGGTGTDVAGGFGWRL